jgi:hypothetical protein
MTTGEFDTEDAPGFLAVALGAVGLTEIGTISVYGYSLADTAFSIGGSSFSWAATLIVAGLIWISFTNEVMLGDWIGIVSDRQDPQGRGQLEDAYYASVVGLLAIVAGMVFITDFSNFVTGSDIAGTAAAGVILAGAGIAAYGG